MSRDLIFSKLLEDEEFRQTFLHNPQNALTDAGIEVGSDTLQRLIDVSRSDAVPHRLDFDDEDVQRCCID